MKKLNLLLISFIFCSSVFGQGFVSFNPEGALTETLLKNSSKEGINSVIETIVNDKVDIANLAVKYKLTGGSSFSAATPLPGNFTTVGNVTIDKKGEDSKDWTLIVHQLKPAPLPFELSFSKTNP